ncbi:DUF2911 domain-containing protein [Hyalangium gracile]|uniref:DUF2911 domain-containing protein n=1 Tax=Hyalangium gracile TaxID=394092 RepID=UPI001CCF1FA9|nr:DUF2911 domain-containing protein [Hyalangium gracile]
MKNAALKSLFVVLAALIALPASAQLQLPAPSPSAKVMQQVGLTDISVEYSSPGVKGRKIWGALVPWDQPWRSGANASTKITFSKDVTFGGKPVPAGTYAIVSFPTQKGWTVALNKELALWQSKEYDAANDVVRVPATTANIPNRERLTYIFSNTTDTGASLDLEWEKLRISVPITVDTVTQAQANIKSALDNAWRPHMNAASYVAENLKDVDTGLKYVDASIAIASTWQNNWVKAELLAKKGNYAEARKYAQVAWDMGQQSPNFFFKDAVAKALADWKNKK